MFIARTGPGAVAIGVAALLALILLRPAASPAQVSSGAISVVNGAQELAEPTTGALLQGTLDDGYLACSVTLVGCDAAVTTAHCFNVNAGEKNYVFFQHAGFIPIESATRHPAYVAAFPPNTPDFDVLLVEDIAFIKLAELVSGITPSSVVRDGAPALGTPGTIVGFGRDPITAASPSFKDETEIEIRLKQRRLRIDRRPKRAFGLAQQAGPAVQLTEVCENGG